MSRKIKKSRKIAIEEEASSDIQFRNSMLKLWKRWMIHGDPGAFNGWLIVDQHNNIAAGW